LLFFPIYSFAQQGVSYRVDSASLAYRHVSGELSTLKKLDKIELSDSVSIKHNGVLVIKSADHRYEEYGPRDVKTVRDLFFSNQILGILGRVKNLLTGRIRPIEVNGYNSVHINKVYGDDDDIKEGLNVAFCCDGKVYSSFHDIPANNKFDIVLTNTSDSVRLYSILFSYKTKAENDFTPLILDSVESETHLDFNPILLVPGETVTIPATFRRLDGFFPYRLNIYGSDELFIIKRDSRAAGKISVYSDEVFVNNHNKVERYYFEYCDE
jgi:hypothetical protein